MLYLLLYSFFKYNQSVSKTNKCMCRSSHALSYGRMQFCVIHNSFPLHGGDVIGACCANKAECQ